MCPTSSGDLSFTHHTTCVVEYNTTPANDRVQLMFEWRLKSETTSFEREIIWLLPLTNWEEKKRQVSGKVKSAEWEIVVLLLYGGLNNKLINCECGTCPRWCGLLAMSPQPLDYYYWISCCCWGNSPVPVLVGRSIKLLSQSVIGLSRIPTNRNNYTNWRVHAPTMYPSAGINSAATRHPVSSICIYFDMSIVGDNII